MKALTKTLFGDLRNFCTVMAIIVVAQAMAQLGYAQAAVYIVPLLVLSAVAWLAHH
jgi:hypothetical protein